MPDDAATDMDAGHDPRARAAEVLRRFGHTLMEREADDELLERVTAAAERTIAELEAAPRRTRDFLRIKQQFFPQGVEDGQKIVHFDECFVSGRWNPLGIGIEVWREGEGVRATVALGAAFEGAPGALPRGDRRRDLRRRHGLPADRPRDPGVHRRADRALPGADPDRDRADLPLVARPSRRTAAADRGRRASRARSCIGTATATFIEVDPASFKP